MAPPKDEEPASEVVADEKPDTEVGDDEKPTTEASVEEKPENTVPETAETAVLSDEEGTALMENGVYIKVIGDKKNTVVIVAESESVSGEELAERLEVFKKNGQLLEAERLEMRTNQDVENMR